ncbi:MFS transporter [Mesorhizobium sp. M1C.F.Ca.ET.193.01.1.1]|uniref:MFS transporter n=1 Tax=unclassified Mesorhizobium TaxID=325217 RepID=UPI000FD2549D|nr:MULTISPECIES: MFS transporter [unclassified Mesorhizobium]TGS97289.1 MFS transporter [bacterium M00.F.Ca.ET.177.01.1.1]TGQ52460.1 MFS transporter [Mesorhizobium sp. M1C.F.Ca.ET.210.01.1.1]TGQ69082.1 MFS transporter [Mesorhizobium sp. M1C.F.Ca.ET.212.01.1.1]TGR05098.1 MFS transporter [Mesorhizobium sp. M1C.F.Ca.ET.204.01.1.1]TGR25703.1 MFS transporter [Mesorhizobium sp. M1C.F.Ca.ET.196.01.1.1]
MHGNAQLADRPAEIITRPQTLLFAASVGIIVTNLFAPQTLVGLIGPSLGAAASESGLVSMATLLGYAAGLFFLVPLSDLVENRVLVLRMLVAAALAAAVAAFAPSAASLLAVLFMLGAACSCIQVLVPVAASMAPPGQDGRVIGDVMSGLMAGILLSRPLASLVADAFGWRAFYALSAAALALLAILLGLTLPRRRPLAHASYAALIASLLELLRQEPVLRRRAFTASLAMAAFSVFWTAVALRLAAPPFELGQPGIALFALVGAGGAAVTPLFGRAGDRGWTRPATMLCHLGLIAALGLAAWAGGANAGDSWLPLVLMGASAVLLDIGVTGDQTLGRRAVNLLQPKARGRINGLFVGIFFIGGAVGSLLAGVAWAWGGWPTVCAAGAMFGVIALAADWMG